MTQTISLKNKTSLSSLKQVSRQNNSQVTPLLQKEGGHRVGGDELVITERNSLNIDKNIQIDQIDQIPKIKLNSQQFMNTNNEYKNRNPSLKKEPLMKINMKQLKQLKQGDDSSKQKSIAQFFF